MGVKVRIDRVADVAALINRLTGSEVLVGIPGDGAERKEGDEGPVTNAELGYIHEFGVPERNIPARPFLIPGVEALKPQIIERMKRAGKAALNGDKAAAERQLDALGVAAQKAVRTKITDGPFEPLKDATKAARLRRRAAYQNASPEKRAHMMAAYLEGDFSPLIDTGQLRRSVTYVVAKKGK